MKSSSRQVYYISQLTGYCLKQYRNEKGWSGYHLAQKCGVSQQQLSRYERSETVLTVDMLFNFLVALGISPPRFYIRLFESLLTHPNLSRFLPYVNMTGWKLDHIKQYYQANTVI